MGAVKSLPRDQSVSWPPRRPLTRDDLDTMPDDGHRYGCPSYWVLDPDTPSLIAWEMQDGAYVQVAKVTGTESARLTSPYDVTVVPADLTL
jgi:hypothetical protein